MRWFTRPGAELEAPSDGCQSRDVAEHPMNLLVISYHFPPDSAVGALRWGGITKYLAKAGWSVDVLTGGEAVGSRPVGGVRVHSVPRGRILNDVYKSVVAHGFRSHPDKPVAREHAAESQSYRTRTWRRFRQALAVSLSYPDYSRGWVVKATREARRIITRQRIGLVVSSGPPHTAHLIAMLATAGTGTRWLMDMRDPWDETFYFGTPAILGWSTRRLAKMAFGRADGIICNTRQYAEHLRERRVGGPVHWIPNGIDLEDLPSPVRAPARPLTVAYVGTLYFNRDLGPVIQAMEAFLSTRSSQDRSGIRLRFAGQADPEHEDRLHREVEASGLGREHVETLGRVPRSEAWEVMQKAHLSLVLAQKQPMQVPAKLYESVGLGVQTIVLAEPGSAAASEAERVGALWKDPSDIAGIRDVLEGLYTARLPARTRPIARCDYESIAGDVADVLTKAQTQSRSVER